jgi:hypothetical protein
LGKCPNGVVSLHTRLPEGLAGTFRVGYVHGKLASVLHDFHMHRRTTSGNRLDPGTGEVWQGSGRHPDLELSGRNQVFRVGGDYCAGPMVRDSHTRKYRRTRLFVLTLGYSRKSVRLLVFRSSSQTWAELHEQAFRRLGGVTRTIVLDNLREGVLIPDIYDPTVNPLYRDVLRHYQSVLLPCRVADPDRKAYASYCTSLAELRLSSVLAR